MSPKSMRYAILFLLLVCCGFLVHISTKVDMLHDLYSVRFQSTVYDLNVSNKRTIRDWPKQKKSSNVNIATDKEESVANSSVPIPPNKYVGLIKKGNADELKGLNFDFLPISRATDIGNVNKSSKKLLTFVDTSCGACKRFHKKISTLNSLGIDVMLAPYPRSGINSRVGKLMLSAWCTNDKQKKLIRVNKAFKGHLIANACEDQNLIADFNKFAKFGEMYLNKTTPVSFTDNGVIVMANLDSEDFLAAFKFGEEMSMYVRNTTK
ncbi:MAG: thioredoxin fold domain-containing protein [Endozoicomonadaceae bacterium]|nr:thioredoxin fold domain-containing protein [Endozoicomonadaceae bacterium]